MAESVRAIVLFLLLVTACAGLIAATASLTRERIEANRQRQFLAMVSELTGNPAPDTVRWHGDVAHLCDGTMLLRGSVSGYGGPIRWLAAAADGPHPMLTGVRITAHQETPGIADFLNQPRSGWLARLRGRDARGIEALDGVSGATITSRALRRSLAAALRRPELTGSECPS